MAEQSDPGEAWHKFATLLRRIYIQLCLFASDWEDPVVDYVSGEK